MLLWYNKNLSHKTGIIINQNLNVRVNNRSVLSIKKIAVWPWTFDLGYWDNLDIGQMSKEIKE